MHRIIEVSGDFKVFRPDWDEVLTFFLNLTKRERQILYEHLHDAAETSLQQHSNDKRSVVSDLYHALSEEIDPQSYLQQCEVLIEKHWTEGFPLLRQLIKDHVYQNAQSLLDKMLAAYLTSRRTKTWTPESSLFVSLHPWYPPESDVKRLLQMNGWLEGVREDRKAFLAECPYVILLTKDLLRESAYGRRYPALRRMMSKEVTPLENDKSRRQWLKRMEASKSLPRLIRVWQEHAQAMLSDPKTCGSFYQEVADWLGVLKELNPKAYTEVIARWKISPSPERQSTRITDRLT